MGDYVLLAISAILVNNILLIQYLGNCPFLGTSKKMDTAVGMAMAVVFVLAMAGIVTWVLEVVFSPIDYDQLCCYGGVSDQYQRGVQLRRNACLFHSLSGRFWFGLDSFCRTA